MCLLRFCLVEETLKDKYGRSAVRWICKFQAIARLFPTPTHIEFFVFWSQVPEESRVDSFLGIEPIITCLRIKFFLHLLLVSSSLLPPIHPTNQTRLVLFLDNRRRGSSSCSWSTAAAAGSLVSAFLAVARGHRGTGGADI